MQPFQFYSQVYGIEDVIVVPVVDESSVNQKAPSADADRVSSSAHEESKPASSLQVLPSSVWILFVSQLRSKEFQSYREMFYKIIAAMGLKESEFALSLHDQPLSIDEGICVQFESGHSGWSENSHQKIRHLTVPALEDMAQQPELKKTAWTLLKQTTDFRPAF